MAYSIFALAIRIMSKMGANEGTSFNKHPLTAQLAGTIGGFQSTSRITHRQDIDSISCIFINGYKGHLVPCSFLSSRLCC